MPHEAATSKKHKEEEINHNLIFFTAVNAT